MASGTVDLGATFGSGGGGGGGSGTVTSVALSMPAIFSVAGSPITTSGTFITTLNTQSPNLVFAGPTSGGAAVPTFRSLVAADIPALPYASSTLTNAHIFVGNGSNVATDVAVSGDLTLINTGAFTIANAAVTGAKIAALTITNANIANATIDLTTKVTGALPIANGGTGQITANAGFNALSPMTTGGDLIYGGASGAGTRLANGSSLQLLQSNGGTSAPSWVNPYLLPRTTQAGAYALVASDKMSIVVYTGATAVTFSITAAATLGAGWWCYVRNGGSGAENAGQLTLDPNAAETIDGLTTVVTYPNDLRLITCDGTSFFTQLIQGGSVQYTTSGATTFTVPSKVTKVHVELWGGGGAGGGGRRGAAASVRSAGGGGGGGAFTFGDFSATAVGASVTVTVAAAAAAGAGGAADNTSGAVGADGANSTFGTLLTAYGGGGGRAGGTVAVTGGGGGGALTAGVGATGGGPTAATSGSNFGGASGTSNVVGSESGYGGGAGGGSNTAGTTGFGGGNSYRGGGGGGAGGPISAADGTNAGGAGGDGQGALNSTSSSTPGAIGASAGAVAAGISSLGGGEAGSGGGSGTAGAAAGNGAAGRAGGGAGGGGGASFDGQTAGNGGAGGLGLCRVWYI